MRRGRASLRCSRLAALQLVAVLPFAGIHVSVQIFDVGEGALLSEPDDLLYLSVNFLSHMLEVFLVSETGLLQLVLERDDRIGLAPLLLFFSGAIFVRVDDRVAFEPIAEGFDESRFGISAGAFHYLRRPEPHLAQVHAIDPYRLHVIRAGALVDLRDRGRRRHRRAHPVLVVDAEPDHWELKTLAKFNDSWKAPMFVAPSPNMQRTTS